MLWIGRNTMSRSTPFIIERLIGSGIFVGVNKKGESIKINENYYRLKDVVKVNNRLE